MQERETCLQKKTGSCAGCPIIDMVNYRFRWEAVSPEIAAQELQQLYCPSDAKPQMQYVGNKEACFSMGQRRDENIIFAEQNRI